MTGYGRFFTKPAEGSDAPSEYSRVPSKRRALIALKAAVAVFWSTVCVVAHVSLVLAVFFNPRLSANQQLFSAPTTPGVFLLVLFICDFLGLIALSYLVMVQ